MAEPSIFEELDNNSQNLFDVALYIDEAYYACNMIFAIIGILFNLLVISIIVLSKELHLRRVLLWLGTGVSNILILVSYLMISQSVLWGSSSSIRTLCIWFAIFSTIIQSWNIFFAALERHMYINHPKLHNSIFNTTTSIVVVQLSPFILLFLVFGTMMNLHIFQEMELFNLLNFKLIGSFVFGLLPLLLAVQVVLMRTLTNEECHSTTTTNVCHQPNSEPINRLDFKAAQTYLFLVKMHLFFHVVKLIPYILIFICLHPISEHSSGSGAECSSFIKGFYFTSSIMGCIHSSIANPVSFFLLAITAQEVEQ